jgi:heme exporter protein A
LSSTANASRPTWIEARGLAFARGSEPIFGPLDLSVQPGMALLIEGGNGSGKTTLLRVLAGLIEPTGGELAWSGERRDPWRPAPGELSLHAHQLGLKPDLSPAENLDFARALGGAPTGLSISAALVAVGLEGYEDLPIRRLSAGQRKRAALAVLLIARSSVWLLDEPYANLDREGHALVERLVSDQLVAGGAVVMTSHGHFAPTAVPHTRLALGTFRA